MKALILAALLFLFSRTSTSIGAGISMIIGLSSRIPYIGKLIRFLLMEPLCLWGVIKPIAWVISGSSAALGLYFYVLIFGELTTKAEFWVVCAVATISIAQLANRFVTFDILSPEQHLVNAINFLDGTKLGPDYQTVADHAFIQLRLIRSTFVDLRMSEFIGVGFLFGLLYYACGELLLFGNQSPWSNIYDPLLYSFSKASLVTSGINSASGIMWNAINAFHSLILLVWAVCFFALSSSLIPSQAPFMATVPSKGQTSIVDSPVESRPVPLNSLNTNDSFKQSQNHGDHETKDTRKQVQPSSNRKKKSSRNPKRRA